MRDDATFCLTRSRRATALGLNTLLLPKTILEACTNCAKKQDPIRIAGAPACHRLCMGTQVFTIVNFSRAEYIRSKRIVMASSEEGLPPAAMI